MKNTWTRLLLIGIAIVSLTLSACGGGGGSNNGPSLNSDPIPHAGSNQNVTTGSIVTLDGSGSHDPDGDLLTFLWTITSKPIGSTATLSNTSDVKPTFIADYDGEYVLRLTVDDGTMSALSSPVIITASTTNSAPVANAGPDQNVSTGTLVTLDGRASSDADGDPLTYSWIFTSMPPASNATLSSTTSVNPTFNADLDGIYTLLLIVNDGTVDSSADTVIITSATINSAPVADAGQNQSVPTGIPVKLNGSASTDADGDLLIYNWSFTNIPGNSNATLINSTDVMPTFTPDVAGPYIVSLIASDGQLSSTPVAVTITAASVGTLTTQIGIFSSIQSVALQSDGKIVVAGTSSTDPVRTQVDVTVARYHIDGSLDSSFAGNGIVTTNIGRRVQSSDWVRDVAIQPDGKILVAGYSVIYMNPAHGVTLVRYNLDGSLDSTFADGGILYFEGGNLDWRGQRIILQPDNKIVLAGHTASNPGFRTLLIRFNNNGSLDTSFANNGILIDETTGILRDAVLQADGKIVVVGTKNYDIDFTDYFAIARYDSGGRLDTSFGNSGVINTEIGSEVGSSNTVSGVALQSDGKILVCGTSVIAFGPRNFALVRYDPNGSLDTSFADNGIAMTNGISLADIANSCAVQSDGKILVAGESHYYNNIPNPYTDRGNFSLVRFNEDGRLDKTFANEGSIVTDFNEYTAVANKVKVQADGRIILAGSNRIKIPGTSTIEAAFAVARYTIHGIPDPTFNPPE